MGSEPWLFGFPPRQRLPSDAFVAGYPSHFLLNRHALTEIKSVTICLAESDELFWNQIMRFHSIHCDSSHVVVSSFAAFCCDALGKMPCFLTGFFGGSSGAVLAAC
jgi:hypothetical protein